ncbi:MAG: L-seryl-tRNA(Sec) selenium transferase [Spirochaetales bacterium]|nr:L-seryl-tRNA(Sec) selenium transferase [Spirochaetales bacterium]
MKKIPQIEQIMNDERVGSWFEKISRPLTAASVRRAVSHYREKVISGRAFSEHELYPIIDQVCKGLYDRRIRPVINATGVILHTNMGRSPILPEVWDDCREVNTGYSNLELSLKTGKRGKRNGLVPLLINTLTGAESSTVVNNNAAAVYLLLSTFAAGKEVIVSRGEQVQIGGGFRIPEILAASGAKLVEVGTTNITTLADYLDAVTDDTAMILKVHRANFALRGFTSEPALKKITEALPDGILTVVDQGSGVLNENLPGEKKAQSLIDDGADIISFSCDKILGGPQGGIIAGKKELIDRLDRHPLMRTMRPGKTIYSLLEATLLHRMENPGARSRHAEAADSFEEASEKCRKIKRGLSADIFKMTDDTLCIGGGSTPDEFFASRAIEIISDKMKPERILKILRDSDPPVIGTIKHERAFLNPSALNDDEMKYLKSVLKDIEENL